MSNKHHVQNEQMNKICSKLIIKSSKWRESHCSSSPDCELWACLMHYNSAFVFDSEQDFARYVYG